MDSTATRTASGTVAVDRLVRRDLLILRLEADRRRRGQSGRLRQRPTRSTR